jgi:hypothetical protein
MFFPLENFQTSLVGSGFCCVCLYVKMGNSFRWVWQECVMGALKGKTTLLVTHQVDFLHGADNILVCNSSLSFFC